MFVLANNYHALTSDWTLKDNSCYYYPLFHQIKSYLAAKQGLHFSSGFHVEVKLSVVDSEHSWTSRREISSPYKWTMKYFMTPANNKVLQKTVMRSWSKVTSTNMGRELPVHFQAETTAAGVWEHVAAAAERWQESLVHKSGITTQWGAQSRWWLSVVWSELGTVLVEQGWAIVFKMCNACPAPCSKIPCLEAAAKLLVSTG